jgi:hypothetical protein
MNWPRFVTKNRAQKRDVEIKMKARNAKKIAASRAAAKDSSPRRKPWVCRKNRASPEGA